MAECLESKAFVGAVKYLTLKGYEIEHIDESRMMVVAWEDGDLVVASVSVGEAGEAGFDFPGEMDRLALEGYALSFLSTHDVGADFRIRFDSICMMCVTPDRAMVRHHINCLD